MQQLGKGKRLRCSSNSGPAGLSNQSRRKAKSVQTAAVDNGDSIPKEGEATVNPPANLPANCAQKEVQTKRSLGNRQTLCKRVAREVGLFRASPWSSNCLDDLMQRRLQQTHNQHLRSGVQKSTVQRRAVQRAKGPQS